MNTLQKQVWAIVEGLVSREYLPDAEPEMYRVEVKDIVSSIAELAAMRKHTGLILSTSK